MPTINLFAPRITNRFGLPIPAHLTCFITTSWPVLVCAVFVNGCGPGERVPVSGTVEVGGEKIDMGRVFLVPVEGATGPRVAARIVNGEYRVDGTGGLQPGKYRVELEALKKTGRKTKGHLMGGETSEVDETIQVAPPAYRGENSPLLIDVPGSAGGRVNISVPAK